MSSGTGRFVSFRTGWALIGLGLALGAAAAFVLLHAVGPAVEEIFLKDACATPCSERLDLDAGHYVVFEQVGTSRTLGPLSSKVSRRPTITPGDVTVTSPSGEPLEVGRTSASEEIDRNGTTYAAVVSFRAPHAGRYQVLVAGPTQTRVLVTPAFGQTVLRALPGVAVAAGGGVAGVAGLVVMVLAWSRRRTARTPA